MDNKSFWTLSPEGTEVLRDLKNENKEFNMDDYFNGKFDVGGAIGFVTFIINIDYFYKIEK